jgi:hypothetical protein
MTNQIQIVAEINTLEAEGLALAKEWKSICSADKKRFNKATKADGFDTRLGKLMLKLKAESDAGRISSARLKDCGIHTIDKRRRSEAMWFVENESACRDFIKASKKGFTSLTALQAAMKKADKSAKADTQDEPKADDKSNVGLDSEADTVKSEALSPSDIALEALIQCETNGVAIKDFMLALKEQLEMLDQTQAVA